MKNHLIKIHNHVNDVSNLPLLQAINIAIRNDSDQQDLSNLEIDLPSESHELVEEIQ